MMGLRLLGFQVGLEFTVRHGVDYIARISFGDVAIAASDSGRCRALKVSNCWWGAQGNGAKYLINQSLKSLSLSPQA